MTQQIQSKVPEIRFSGFDGGWDDTTLGELMPVGSVKRIHQSDWRSSGVRFLRARDIVSIFKNEPVAEYLYISTEKYSQYSEASGKVSVGDLLVTGVGTIGVPYLIPNNDPVYFKDGNIIWFKNENVINGQFLFYSFVSESIQKYIRESAGTGTVGTYTINSGRNTPIRLPSETEEQILIGQHFAKLDAMISQHQRKHAKLVALKKAMLQKMFPRDGATTPEIRFKGFSGDWEEKALGEMSENIPNNTLSRADLNYSAGSAKNVHYGDILVKLGEVLDVGSFELPYISDIDRIKNLKALKLQDGDILFADAAEDKTVGKCTEIFNVGDETVVSGLHTIAVRPSKNFAPMYLGYFLNSPAYHDQLFGIMQGTKVLSVSKTALKQTRVFFPLEEDEQRKISSYFYELDGLITQHATQITKLRNIKAACLEKMFV